MKHVEWEFAHDALGLTGDRGIRPQHLGGRWTLSLPLRERTAQGMERQDLAPSSTPQVAARETLAGRLQDLASEDEDLLTCPALQQLADSRAAREKRQTLREELLLAIEEIRLEQ